MSTLLNLFYSLPVLLALVITGAAVSGKLRGGARRLMWSGIVLLALTQFSTPVSVAMIEGRLPAFAYRMVGVMNVGLTVIGTVLLLLAIARAASEGSPSRPSAPGVPGLPVQGAGGQPYGGDQAYGGGHPYGSGQPYRGGQPYGGGQPDGPGQTFGGGQADGGGQPHGGGQPRPFDEPGTWGDQQAPR